MERQGKAYQVAGVDESEDAADQVKAKKRKKNGGDEDGQVRTFTHPACRCQAHLAKTT